MDYLFQLSKLLGVLALFALGSYWLMKKMKHQQLTKTSPNRYIQIIDGVRIGMKEDVMLLKIGSEYILFSVNGGNMIALNQTHIEPPEQDFIDVLNKQSPAHAITSLTKSIKEGLMKK